VIRRTAALLWMVLVAAGAAACADLIGIPDRFYDNPDADVGGQNSTAADAFSDAAPPGDSGNSPAADAPSNAAPRGDSGNPPGDREDVTDGPPDVTDAGAADAPGPQDAKAEAGTGPTCNANACSSGCCDTNGVCEPGDTGTACGAGGNACTGCMQGQECSAAGTCECTPTSCPSGCCAGDGLCVPYASQSSSQCGTAGAACAQCGIQLSCTTSGICYN
jgi:hypothetical protein